MILKDWWSLFRGEHAIIVFVAVMVSQFVVAKTFSLSFLFPAIGPALITLGAFAWSDYFGLKSDKILQRLDRPLVSGKIHPRAALWVGGLLIAVGVVLTYFVSLPAFWIALTYSVLSLLYDPFLKKRPLVGNAFIAASMSISFIYGNAAITPSLDPHILLYAAIAFLAGLGRELIITLRDVEGDRKMGATTLPMVLGPKKTVILTSVLIFAAAFLSLTPLLRSVHPVYVVLVVATDALFLAGAYFAVLSQRLENLKKARQLTLYGMLFGVLAFAALGL